MLCNTACYCLCYSMTKHLNVHKELHYLVNILVLGEQCVCVSVTVTNYLNKQPYIRYSFINIFTTMFLPYIINLEQGHTWSQLQT